MRSRFDAAITSSKEGCHGGDTTSFVADADLMVRTSRATRSALPAPDQIASCPSPSEEEEYEDFCDIYSSILRDMRDMHVTGHILHADMVSPLELELLASGRTFFIKPEGDSESQGILLEYQDKIVLHTTRITILNDLIDQYDIKSLIILDPEKDGIRQALRHLDPDQISIGGYGTGSEEEYWKVVNEKANISINQE